MRQLLTLALIVMMNVQASAADATAGRFVEVSPANKEVLADLLVRIDSLASEGLPAFDPVVIVIHGPEAPVFLRRNYVQFKDVVDLAARLDALGLADIRMCETWMRNNGVVRGDLAPFVDTVRFAPEEIARLEDEGFVRF